MSSSSFWFLFGMVLGAICVFGAAVLIERWDSDWAWDHLVAWWLSAFVGGEIVASGILAGSYLVTRSG